jgi:hypothetical protein
MIVKLQVPIEANVPEDKHLALLYDKSRHFEMMTPITDEIRKQLNGRPRAFFQIDLRDTGGQPFRFVHPLPEQGW